MKCTNSDCPWVNELGLLEAHRKTCGYVLMPCANGCGGHSNRDKLHYHYTEVCPLRRHVCIHCKEVGTYKEITSSHLDVCPDALVACPNSGCGASIKKRDITFHHSVCPDVKELCPNSECGANIKRKDLESHLSECQYEIIGCIYRNIGCAFTSPRHAMVDHRASLSGYHLDLAMVQLEKQGEEIVKHLKEQQQKHVDEIMTQQKEQHQKHVEEMMAQLKEQHQKHVEEMIQLKEQYKIQVAYSEKITDLLKLKPSEEHVTLQMASYDWHFGHKRSWYSNGFYTHHQGYKMCLNVDAFGSAEGEGTHVSVYLYLMKGENDDKLIWPLRYKCTVTLLNQVMDGHHLAKTFKDEMSRVVPTGKKGSAAEGATARSLAGKGFPMFIVHDQLDLPEHVGQCKYLMDDCLYFRVQVKFLPPPKPWLVLTVDC